MRTFHVLGGLVALVLAAIPASATSIDLRPAVADLVGGADVIVVATVSKVQKDVISALPTRGAKKKEPYKIIEVKVQDDLQGAKDLKSIKIGIPCSTLIINGKSVNSPLVDVKERQEGVLFLTRHHSNDFYELGLGNLIAKEFNTNYKADLELTRKCVKLLAAPDDSLKSKNAEERLLAAAMLIRKYRGPLDLLANSGLQPAKPAKETRKEEPISAEQSKLILNVLSEVDWKTAENPTPSSPANLFVRLGLTPKDGWKYKQGPVNFLDGKAVLKSRNELATAAKAWLKANAGTYRIKRFVGDEEAKTDESKDSKKDKQ
jgi:hypothetical protein